MIPAIYIIPNGKPNTEQLCFMLQSSIRLTSILSRLRLLPYSIRTTHKRHFKGSRTVMAVWFNRSYCLPSVVFVLAWVFRADIFVRLGLMRWKITDWVNPKDTSGEFKRGASAFRSFISSKAGAQYPPERGRYHLYVSYACPWGTYVRDCDVTYRLWLL